MYWSWYRSSNNQKVNWIISINDELIIKEYWVINSSIPDNRPYSIKSILDTLIQTKDVVFKFLAQIRIEHKETEKIMWNLWHRLCIVWRVLSIYNNWALSLFCKYLISVFNLYWYIKGIWKYGFEWMVRRKSVKLLY